MERTVSQSITTRKNIPNKLSKILRKYVPCPVWFLLGFSAISGIVYFLCTKFPSLADGITQSIGAALRFLFAHLTSWIPFSVAEITIVTLPFTIGAFCIYLVRLCKRNEIRAIRLLALVIAIATAAYSLFLWMFAIGYRGTPLDQKLGMDRQNVSAKELTQTAEILAKELQKAEKSVFFADSGFSVMPYSYTELNRRLNSAYATISETYDFIPSLRANVKFIALSKVMSYTHFTGVYIYYTGEANINIDFPTFSTVYTAAHEMSHQRGIAPEDEANFMAFLVCLASEDAYIRYCAYLNMFQYVSAKLYAVDAFAYTRIYSSLPRSVRLELAAYSAFFDQYRESAVAQVTDAMNDNYLKSHGQKAGTQSYGLVVDLAVAYYRANGTLS